MTIIDARERFTVPRFDIYDRLVKARESAGLSQERMAELLGCSRRTITRYETGGKLPRSVVLAYHVATQTDLGWLATGVEHSEVSLSGELAPWEECAPRDLNPEPTDSGTAAVPILAEVVELRPSAEHLERIAA